MKEKILIVVVCALILFCYFINRNIGLLEKSILISIDTQHKINSLNIEILGINTQILKSHNLRIKQLERENVLFNVGNIMGRADLYSIEAKE